MAEILVSAVVGVVVEKLFSAALMKFAQSQGIDPGQLEEWKKTLPKIKALLADAGQKQIKDEAVKLWLNDLQELAYDIDDVLDDIATEVMKQDIKRAQASTSTSTRSKLLKMLPTCCTNCTPSKLIYGQEFNSKLAAFTSKMKNLYDLKQGLGLVELNISNNNKSFRKVGSNRITTSSVNVSKVLGREKDKDALIGQLLGNKEACSNQDGISTVSIVGMGGLGKTTLAQLLYNDQRVKDHFELRAWVCVSEEFDVFNISMAIYQAVGGEDKQFATLDLLHAALKEKLSKKRFLVVLDDVWKVDHRTEWNLLRSAFDVGAHGSKFLVTTRIKEVALVMDSSQTYMLEVLSEEISLSLLAQSALGEQNFDDHQPLKFIAQGIVKKCDGLPLALIALGRVLKTKGNEEEEWEKLLYSDIWNSDDKNDILPALKLSYYDLPSDLKQMFAYCSLFPKDYEFEKKKLVLLWMAQGFLSQPKAKNQPVESLGDDYFKELLSRSFFQPLGNDESRYIMHDLMNDLAKSVAGEFFFRLDENMNLNGSNEAYEKLRHFSFIVQQQEAEYKKFKELHRAGCLRTFLSVSVGWDGFNKSVNVIAELLPHLHFLRVLSLTNKSITEVPQSIGNLKHLRYLNFSNTDIQRIPEEVSELYNLQSLLVRDCRKLSSLPVSFAKLINLRHLDLTDTPSLKKLPLGIGGLTSLQTLSKVVIEGGNRFKVSELGLMDLKGALCIEGLEKVIDPTEANDANLKEKMGLDDLELEWSDVLDDSRDPVIEYKVLERLRAPHSNLKKLKITGYRGMKFPNWVGNPTSFDRLSELTLRGCENCTDLPILGHLSSLRKLCLSSMKAVQTVGFELLVPTKPFHGNAFPSLESLEVDDMQSLEIWSTSVGDDGGTPQSFPSLRVISIKRCPKLDKVSFGLIPSLQDLNVEGCPEAVLRDLVGGSSSIRRLNLDAIKGLTQLDREVLKHLGAVEDLSIWDCEELRYLWESESEACRFLGSLKKLEIRGCSKLESIKGEKEVVNVGSSIMGSLRHVKIEDCDALESYCCPTSVETLEIGNCSSMTSLSFSKMQEEDLPSSNLKSLHIYNCKNIKSISQEHLQSLTSLEEMIVGRCPSMEDSFPSCGWLWPPNLRSLWVGELKKPMSEWGLQNYPSSLVELRLFGKNSGVVSFGVMEDHNNNNNTTTSSTCFLLPPSLTYLKISGFMEVESVSEVQHLPLLQRLEIINCPKLRDVPESTSSLAVAVQNW